VSLNLQKPPEASSRVSPRPSLPTKPAWERRYSLALVAIDVVALGIAAALAQLLRFGPVDSFLSVGGDLVGYPAVATSMVSVWLAVIALSGGYSPRVVGIGSEEFRRVFNAAVRFLALGAIVFYVTRLDVARGFVAGFIPAATVLTIVGRYCARKWLHRRRGQGRFLHRVVVVGTIEAATDLACHLQRSPYAGYAVVGACIPAPAEFLRVGDQQVPVLGLPGENALDALVTARADVLAIAGDSALAPGSLRALAWQLEGTGIDLIVAPAVTDVAGPRIAIRPVAGVPLLHVEEPQLSGPARLFKECFDRSTAAVALVVLSPLFLAISVAIRISSPGGILFHQERVGRHGSRFTISKFRTMVDSAEEDLAHLLHLNEHDGLLFKLRDDPRRTRVGCWLRRFSLDELPQLWHVVTGQMSLVGPRPPLPCEVERYGEDVRRRLLVKPGLTGLWQVSGRAELAWDETVRLDLYYVDNWSPALDFLILWKTVNAVLRGRGAY
jgi:exopolysaccharide biosynthesis polyprenyl glycosylphosphotransferase